jgi:hypothetical protein
MLEAEQRHPNDPFAGLTNDRGMDMRLCMAVAGYDFDPNTLGCSALTGANGFFLQDAGCWEPRSLIKKIVKAAEIKFRIVFLS